MNNLLKFVFVLTGFVYEIRAYNVDAIDVFYNFTQPDIVDGSGRIVQKSRGVFGISGTINVVQDIDTDVGIFEVKVFYSTNGISYQLSPFRLPSQNLTYTLNNAYPKYVMAAMLECCTNVPNIVDEFVPPLTKRLVKCDNCKFPTDNFPSALRPGYYRLALYIQNPDVYVGILLKLEVDW